MGEPITLAQARSWLRLGASEHDFDDEITELIRSAREEVEGWIDQCLVATKYRLKLSCFPIEIAPPKVPLLGVDQITYTDTAGDSQTLSSAVYTVETGTRPGMIYEADGQSWPSTYAIPYVVNVDFWAGYGPHTSVALAITAGSDQEVTPASMNGIFTGNSFLVVKGDTREIVRVTATTSTTFTATFANSFGAGALVRPIVPERLIQAIKLLVCARFFGRGDSQAQDQDRAIQAAMACVGGVWHGAVV